MDSLANHHVAPSLRNIFDVIFIYIENALSAIRGYHEPMSIYWSTWVTCLPLEDTEELTLRLLIFCPAFRGHLPTEKLELQSQSIEDVVMLSERVICGLVAK